MVWFACHWTDPDHPPAFLPNLPGDVASHASALDEAGTKVGAASLDEETSRARLWWNGGVHDLNALLAAPLPFQLAGALDLGASGRILAVSEWTPGSGFVHVVLTPIPHAMQLSGAPDALSVGAGGTQVLDLDAGGAAAGALYLVAGSLSGTEPGLTLAGVTLPLNPDPYFFHTLSAPGSPPLAGSLGFLDAAGRPRRRSPCRRARRPPWPASSSTTPTPPSTSRPAHCSARATPCGSP